jgi:hypothetical protein
VAAGRCLRHRRQHFDPQGRAQARAALRCARRALSSSQAIVYAPRARPPRALRCAARAGRLVGRSATHFDPQGRAPRVFGEASHAGALCGRPATHFDTEGRAQRTLAEGFACWALCGWPATQNLQPATPPSTRSPKASHVGRLLTPQTTRSYTQARARCVLAEGFARGALLDQSAGQDWPGLARRSYPGFRPDSERFANGFSTVWLRHYIAKLSRNRHDIARLSIVFTSSSLSHHATNSHAFLIHSHRISLFIASSATCHPAALLSDPSTTRSTFLLCTHHTAPAITSLSLSIRAAPVHQLPHPPHSYTFPANRTLILIALLY